MNVKRERWEADKKCVALKCAGEMLVLLRTPRTREEIETHMGISASSAGRWLRAMMEVLPIKKETQYLGGGPGKRVVTYRWDGGLLPEISHYTATRSLDGCLFLLGATEAEIIKAKKASMSPMDYRGWVATLFRDRLKQHPPSKSSAEAIRMYIQAHDRANDILFYRGRVGRC